MQRYGNRRLKRIASSLVLLGSLIAILLMALASTPTSTAASGSYTEDFTTTPQPQKRINVIVDMDAACDDWSAILYLLKHPSISVIGIGVSCGVSYVDQGVCNTLRILEYLGIEDVPVAAGKATPLVGSHAFPTPWREGSNNSYGLSLPPTSLQPSSMNASELIISLAESSGENVTIVSLGPLTNVAIALQAQPAVKSKIDRILLMGGAVNVPGNVGPESGGAIPNYVAEWNMWVDPHAADIVFRSGLPITMIPLDATNQVPQTTEFKARLASVMTTPEARLLYNMTTPGLYFWDELTAVSLTNPEVVTLEAKCIEIVVALENHEGQTNSTDVGPANAIVAMTADASTFEHLFITCINATTTTTPPPIPGFPWPAMLVAVAAALSLSLHRRRPRR